MRSRLAARSTRLVLAAAAVTALAATTACESQDSADAGSTAVPVAATSSTPGDESTGSSGAQSATGGDSDKDTGTGTDAGTSVGTDAGTDAGNDTGTAAGTDTGDKSGYGQACGTNDLDLAVTWETAPDVDGYYRVTARAKSGITCYLDVNTPSVSFGSGADGVASPVGQGGEDPIKLSGSAVAYTGIDAKTTDGDAGTQFDHVIVSVTEDDPDPAELELPDMATVDKPIVTNWSTVADETVPRII